jgi:ankyrin repeat protein
MQKMGSISEIINERQEKGQYTPLIRACQSGQAELVRYLIEDLRADHTLASAKDENCLHAAVKSKKLSVVSYLTTYFISDLAFLEHESSVTGLTPFGKAVFQNSFEIADIFYKLLPASYATLSKKEGRSLLDLAKASKQHPEAVKYLSTLKLNALQAQVQTKLTPSTTPITGIAVVAEAKPLP